MGKIKLVTKERIENCQNTHGEMTIDHINDNIFVFEKGKIYGIVCENGEGGDILSALLTGQIAIKDEEIYDDDVKVDFAEIQKQSWYVRKCEYSGGLFHREISADKALTRALSRYHKFSSKEEVIEHFGLTKNRLPLKLSHYSGERWRVSLAIGWASDKKIFCFEWTNTAMFNNLMLSGSVFRFFKEMRTQGMIALLPTSRRENVEGIVDEIIEINNPQFKYRAVDDEYFKENY